MAFKRRQNLLNPFTATRRIYMLQKWPCRWPRTYIYVQPQYFFLRICHRYGCCCMSPRFLLRQFVDRCLLSWALFIDKNSSSMLRTVLVQQETALWMFPDILQMRHKLVRAVCLMAFVTTAIEETACFVLLKVRATGMTVEIGWERKLVKGAPGDKKKKSDHTARSWERRPRCSNSQWTLVFVEGSSVRMYEHRREWNIASQLSGELQSGSAATKHW